MAYELHDEDLENVSGGLDEIDDYTLEYGAFYCQKTQALYQNPVYLVQITYLSGNNVSYVKRRYWPGDRKIDWYGSGSFSTSIWVFQEDFGKKVYVPDNVKR